MRVARPLALAWLAAGPVAAQAPSAALAPVERADDLAWKVTGSLYHVPGDVTLDLNVRHQMGPVGGWLGLLHHPHVDTVARVGLEYGGKRGPALVVPTLQLASNRPKAGQRYVEIGGQSYGILGLSRTNLRAFYNLSFDPNESVQLGIGRHLSRYDKGYAFTIFDVRLHTGQQNTHVLWRRRLGSTVGLTLDGLYKSGRLDSGRSVHALGLGAYLDRPRWFAKAYYDPYANFSSDTMLGLGIGGKF